MKKASQNETEMLGLINKIQDQLSALDKKIDTLINRSASEAKPAQRPTVIKERISFTGICADCKKECTVPFKPSGDRPIYCQDCFSRRKVMNMAGMKVEEKPRGEFTKSEEFDTVSSQKDKGKRRIPTGKKPFDKKKPALKKNKKK